MSNHEIGAIALALGLLMGLAHCLGYVFERLRQPRLIGEILAGVLLGPFVLGSLAPSLFEHIAGTTSGPNNTATVLNFIYWIGLFLLMFIAGSQTRGLMGRENRKETGWLLVVGTSVPFLIILGLAFASLLPLDRIVGTVRHEASALLVLAIAVSVTSIPVISRIFYDLKILHTRFASLILGFAVLEDLVLWIILAIATGMVQASASPQETADGALFHSARTLAYIAIALWVAPVLLRLAHNSRLNILLKASPKGYIFVILFAYIAIAAMLDVNLVFGAFLAGFGLVGGIRGTERDRFADSLDSLAKVSSSFFIPVYFAMVGYKLALGADFSMSMLMVFLVGSSLLALLAKGFAASLAGFRGRDVVNLAVTTNARGGPGIVLASVAFDAGIINAAFYTTLVLTAIVTSQVAGAWLRYVLEKGWPLLSTHPGETWRPQEAKEPA
jgi:Kef-type K+ transport system membrane component KefB